MTVKQKDDTYLIEGVVLTANGPNISGRKYDMDSLKKAVDEYNVKDPAMRLGELDGDDVDRCGAHINFEKVSHRVGDLVLHDDGTVTATCEVMKTPMGNIIKDLIESGVKLGVSSRPLQFKPTPVMTGKVHDGVVNDLEFIRIDVTPEKSEKEE